MAKLRDIMDIVHRRIGPNLVRDGIYKIYSTELDDTVTLTFIHTKDLTPMSLTRLAVRYQHYFSDVADTYKVTMLPYSNNFRKDCNTTTIWEHGKGYCI